MKKVMIFIASLIIFTGCTKNTKQSLKKTDSDVKTLIFSVNAVPGDAHHDAMLKFKEVVESESNGRIFIKTYDSGVLFKQDQELMALRDNLADLTYLSAPWLTDLSPWISMLSSGYIWKDYDDMNYILNGDIGHEIFEKIVKEQGIRPLSAYYIGTRQINLCEDKPIRTPKDLSGIKLRMPSSEAWIILGEAMGANPVPIAFSDLYTALQMHIVDGQENPLPTDKYAKFYEVTKSISLTNHLVDTTWPCINEAVWQNLTDEEKNILMDGIKAGKEICDKKNLEEEKEILDFFRQKGLKIYDDVDLDSFRVQVLTAYLTDKNMTSSWDLNLFSRIQETLEAIHESDNIK